MNKYKYEAPVPLGPVRPINPVWFIFMVLLLSVLFVTGVSIAIYTWQHFHPPELPASNPPNVIP